MNKIKMILMIKYATYFVVIMVFFGLIYAVMLDFQAYRMSNKLCKTEGYGGVFDYRTQGFFNNNLDFIQCLPNKNTCDNVILNLNFVECVER